MRLAPATVAATGELLYTVMFPTVPIDQYLEDGNHMVSIDCELARWGAVGCRHRRQSHQALVEASDGG